jgi:type IV pilus assembly protein PilB
MTERPKKRLGEILIEDGRLTRESLEEALNHQKKEGGLIGQILIRLGYVSEEDVVAAVGKQLKIPYLPLANYSVNMEIMQKFPEEFCRRNGVVAFDQDGQKLFVTTSDPMNDGMIEELQKKWNLKIQLFISTPTEIFNMLDLVFNTRNAKKEIKKVG